MTNQWRPNGNNGQSQNILNASAFKKKNFSETKFLTNNVIVMHKVIVGDARACAGTGKSSIDNEMHGISIVKLQEIWLIAKLSGLH